MKNHKSLAIIIPAHNCQETICSTVASIESQICPDDLIIVVENNSTDNTKNLLHERYGSNPLINLVSTQSEGVSSARNIGIKIASLHNYKLIAFCDADDAWIHGRVSKIKKAFNSNKNIGIYYSNYITFANVSLYGGRSLPLNLEQALIKNIIYGNHFGTSSLAFSLNHYITLPFFVESLFQTQDYEFTCHLLHSAIRNTQVYYDPYPSVIYRHENGLSKNKLDRLCHIMSIKTAYFGILGIKRHLIFYTIARDFFRVLYYCSKNPRLVTFFFRLRYIKQKYLEILSFRSVDHV